MTTLFAFLSPRAFCDLRERPLLVQERTTFPDVVGCERYGDHRAISFSKVELGFGLVGVAIFERPFFL